MKSVCAPAKIHLALHIIGAIWFYHYYRNYYKQNRNVLIKDLFLEMLALLFFTFLLNYLCSIGYKITAWIFLAVYALFSILTMCFIKKENPSFFELTAPLNR
jgi:hypothetical protein